MRRGFLSKTFAFPIGRQNFRASPWWRMGSYIHAFLLSVKKLRGNTILRECLHTLVLIREKHSVFAGARADKSRVLSPFDFNVYFLIHTDYRNIVCNNDFYVHLPLLGTYVRFIRHLPDWMAP